MSRNISTLAATDIQSPYLRLGIFAELHFASSIEYVWTGRGSISWNGHTWLGIGDLGNISTITEDSGLTAQGITISLRDIRTDLLAEALGEVKQGLPCKVSIVMFNADNSVSDSIMCYAGRMDQPTLEEGVDTGTVSISIENRLSDLQRAQFRRLTDQDQRLAFPSDDGFKFVNWLLDYNASWPS